MSEPIPEPARRYATVGRVNARVRGLTKGQVDDSQTSKDVKDIDDLRDYPKSEG